jgi:hypothetical protein
MGLSRACGAGGPGGQEFPAVNLVLAFSKNPHL